MNLLPIMLNLAGRRVVVVGGGAVGLRKARAMLDAGAAVTLVALDVEPADLPPGLTVLQQAYDPCVLAGAMLVFACTDDRAVNARIAADARAAGAIVNAADQPEDCDFYSPAVIRDGPVVVAVGTGGASPGLAAFMADKLRTAVPARIGEFADLLSELRGRLRTTLNDSPRRMTVMKSLSNQETFDLFLSAGSQAVHRKFQELLRQP